MRNVFRSMMGACLIALTVSLVLTARSAPAQAPMPAPPAVSLPAPAAATALPPLTNLPASATTAVAPRVASTNAVRSQARVYTVPAQGATGTSRRSLTNWPTGRYYNPLARPWLRPN